ncbi:hypothetical protein FACS1894162_2700 [Bacteroidia bacterium]|nr:hypothetical protein FACS1894162_2700 [Bacteroidia bacterium]
MENRVIKGVLAALAFIAGVAGFSLAVMWLWNAIVPAIFGLAVINYWQALGLLALSKIFFGGMFHMFHGRWHSMHGQGNHIREKWMKMTDEERKEFICKRGFAHPYFHRGFDATTESKEV